MASMAQKKDSERRGTTRRKNDRRVAVAPLPADAERREALDRRRRERRASDAPRVPSEDEFVRWAWVLRAIGTQITRCVQLTDFVDETPDLLVRTRSAIEREDWEQVCVLAGKLERAGLRISSRSVSHDAQRLQHKAASMPQHGSVMPALDQLEGTVERTGKVINEVLSVEPSE